MANLRDMFVQQSDFMLYPRLNDIDVIFVVYISNFLLGKCFYVLQKPKTLYQNVASD